MNEVEKHYAGQDADGRRSGSDTGASGAVETAKRAVGNARESLEDAYEGATSWASERYDRATRTTSYATRRSAAELSRHRHTVEEFVEENPIMVGVAGLAVGLLVGALLPITRRENQYLGRYADEVKEQGLRYAQQLAEQGRSMVEENLGRLPQGRTDRDLGDETTAVR